MKVAVLGAGSWGTALAKVLAENDHEVYLWGRNASQIQQINDTKINQKYLPDTVLPESIMATTDMTVALHEARMILVVVPTSAIRQTMENLNDLLANESQPIIVHATKGLEQETKLRISEVMEEVLKPELYEALAVLSGPSHAEEVARQDITTVTVASHSLTAAQIVQDVFMNKYFRVYTNTDVIGVELGAALKNIIALGAGLIEELGYGDNAKAALITRGLAEISRLGVKMGADPLTFIGLSGVGDLIVTCTSPHSRNWRAGRLIAQGLAREEIFEKVQMVVEGILTCKAAYELAKEYEIEMPITEALYHRLYENASVAESLEALMMREGKQEVSLQKHLEQE